MQKIKERFKVAVLPLSTAVMMAPASMSAFASEATGTEIDLATITADAMSKISGDMKIVIAAAAGASIALIGITVGISYLQKKAKGLKSVA